MSELILIERRGQVTALRFNRPEKKNAITAAMYERLAKSLAEAAADENIRAVALMGSQGCFSAGNDITDFQKTGIGPEETAPVLAFLGAISTFEKPLLAAVDGLAVGVGATLLLHCDMVFASPESWFQTPFTALGLVPEAGSSLLGPRMMGYQNAFEFLIAGEKFSADRALATGLVNRIFPQSALEAETLNAAERLAALPPEAAKLSKQLLKGSAEEMANRIVTEAQIFVERIKTEEAQNAFRAFFAARQQ